MKCETVNIKNGSTGDSVKELQEYLNYCGFYDGNIDGNCGSYTVEAIKNFQRNHGLKVDGNFGTLSCKASSINGADISGTNRTISLNIFQNMIQRFDKYVSDNKAEPKIMYINKEKPYEWITLAKYKEMKARYDKYITDNKTEPNFMYINKNNNSSSTTQNKTTYNIDYLCTNSGGNCLGQITGYHCGPHSIKQALRKFGITGYTERTIGSYAGTTSAGTGHAGLETAIAKIAKLEGITLQVTWKNFSDLGNTINERFKKYGELIEAKNTACFWHEYYRNAYGHYSLAKKVDLTNNTLIIPNSLGSKCNSPAYCGYMENRSFNIQKSYFGGISQKSICIIKKV